MSNPRQVDDGPKPLQIGYYRRCAGMTLRLLAQRITVSSRKVGPPPLLVGIDG